MAWTFGEQNTKKQEILFSDMLHFELEVSHKAIFHADFLQTYKKMQPIINSPGIMGTRTMSSCVCRNLASHGCIVYSMEHTDGSA
mmetsp:Transcript_8677/g.9854  ORF Transcript_8677/g.9854 Transcript_8677/m.9854 type:complete len:85 (+) Transcript_8677:473-727(+)